MHRLMLITAATGATLFATAAALAWDDALTTEQVASAKPAASPTVAPAPAETAKNGKGPRELPAFTHEREAAALTFVRANHPELAELLEPLKKNNKGEYQRAVRELFRQSERLAQVQEKNPRRYAFELQDWKLNSRIQILVARLSMSHEAAVEQQLRQLVIEQLELRKQQLLEDRQRIVTRLTEADEQLAGLDRDQNERVEKRLKELLNGAKKHKKAKE